MLVLLAGATGAIGRILVPALQAAGHEVIGITRRAGALRGTGATEIVADVLRREEFLAAVTGIPIDAVMHQLTALAKPPLTHRAMRQTNRLRTEGTSSLVAAARAAGATRIVAASIFYGYGFGWRDDEMITESEPFGLLDGGPNDEVLRAVLSNEQQVLAAGGIALRYGLFYEPNARAITPVSRRWDGTLPVVHIEDAARAAVLALTRGKAGQVYNVAADEHVTMRQLQKRRALAAGASAPMELPDAVLRAAAPFGAQLATATSVRMSSAKARRALGWSPKYPDLESGLPLVPESERVPSDAAAPAAAQLPTRAPAPSAANEAERTTVAE